MRISRFTLVLAAAALTLPQAGHAQSLGQTLEWTGDFADLSGGGLGSVTTLLTVQSRSGSGGTGCNGEDIVTATGQPVSNDGGCQLEAGVTGWFADHYTQDGANATQARAASTLAGWNWSDLRLIVNFNGNVTAPEISDLRLVFYNAAGQQTYFTDMLASAVTATVEDNANGFGAYGFVFKLTGPIDPANWAYIGAAGRFAGMDQNVTVSLGHVNSTVPEPSTVALLATGLLGLGAAGYRRRRRQD